MARLFLIALLVLLAPLAQAPLAQAAESAAVRSPRAVATLVSAAGSIAPGEAIELGLRLRLAPGWHGYWQNPGDAGAPPEVRLLSPPGAEAGPIRWPAPQRIPTGPLVSFGYEGEVLLPFRVAAPASLAPGETLAIEAEATWLVCAELCIPEEGRFRLDLPVAATGRVDAARAPLFTTAEAAAPRPSPWAARAALAGPRGSLVLEGDGLSPATVRDAFFFPAEGGLLDNAAPQPLNLRNGRLTLALTRPEGAATPATLAGVVALTDAGGVRSAYAVAAPVGGAPEKGTALPLWQALLSALARRADPQPDALRLPDAGDEGAGARAAGRCSQRRGARAMPAYPFGVLATFLALAAVLVGAARGRHRRSAGASSSTRRSSSLALAWLLFAVGLNLSGAFESAARAGAGGAWPARGGCGRASSPACWRSWSPRPAPRRSWRRRSASRWPSRRRDPGGLLALGLGLASPYLAALAVARPERPAAAGRLDGRAAPVLAFPMYASAAWLIWVLAQQAGPDGLCWRWPAWC